MTVCISVLCKQEDKTIVASDRMVTDRGIPIEFESSESKFRSYENDEVKFVFTSAGSALLPERFKRAFKSNLDSLQTVHQAANLAKNAHIEAKRAKFEEIILAPRGITIQEFYNKGMHNTERGEEWDRLLSDFSLDIDIILAGVDQTGAHSFRITGGGDISGLMESFNDLGFDAIGSGNSLARDSLTSRYRADHSTGEALYVTYAALSNASQAPGVGNQYDIAVVDSSGVQSLQDEVIEHLADLYEENESAATIPDEIDDLLREAE